jgi:hypothetical protein
MNDSGSAPANDAQAPGAELQVDFRRLRTLLEAADDEVPLAVQWGERAFAGELLQTTLWRMRRQIIAAPDALVTALRPFARVSRLLDGRQGGSDAVLLSLRTHGAKADYVQLRGRHFFDAHELVRRHGKRT